MNSRERVIKAIEFNGPDKVPNGSYWQPGALNKYGQKLIELFSKYPRDFIDLHDLQVSERWRIYEKGIYKDCWGCVWKNIQTGLLGRIIKHPLANATLEIIKEYETPDPSKVINFNEVKKSIIKTHDKYVLGDAENFFERLHWLRGFENTLIDITLGRPELIILLDKLFKYKIELIKLWLELDVDGMYFLDDWGTQERLMIRPEQWRKYFKPYYKRMFELVHKAGKHVFFHSDGYVLDIIPDLIEIGADAINVQVKLIGIDTLSKQFGGKICFLSDIDRQYLLPFGTPKEIEKHVKHIINALGCFNGGLISWGEINIDVPLENAEAMLRAFNKWGRYHFL